MGTSPEELLAVVETLLAKGRFKEADERLRNSRREIGSLDAAISDVVSAELFYELGDISAALLLTNRLLQSERVTKSVIARAARARARAELSQGRLADAARSVRMSIDAAEAESLRRPAACALMVQFGLVLQTQPLETAIALLPGVRRAVTRVADPHLLVELHLLLAQCESRRHSPAQALKHFRAAEALLEGYPHLALSAILQLGWSNVEGFLGDYESSLERARVAFKFAQESGHAKTRIGAATNIAHILCWRGDFGDAEGALRVALAEAKGDLHLRRGALDCLANIQMEKGEYDAARETLQQLEVVPPEVDIVAFHWDALTVLYSNARLALFQGNHRQALRLLDEGVSRARACDDQLWQKRMLLAKARCLGQLGCPDDAAKTLSAASEIGSFRLEELALFYGALASAESSARRSEAAAARAVRITAATSQAALERDVLSGLTVNREALHEEVMPPSIDAAVAVIELGAYTHVLGPEVLAVVDGAGCTRGAALVARAPAGPRVIDARGWDEHAAVAAARKPKDLEIIPLGEYRDEPWELIVDPRPELEHRCTLVAIRKLVATALSLERYRREEKQRTALWPAEALDGETGAVWASEQTSEILSIARRIAPTPLSVLLTGETGTGKEMLAHAIHRASDRADRTFLPFNCTAVPREMLESQLFGYRKGAFTGADASFAGVIRSAAGGTLFLDEIADVPLDVQPKLLRFLETHEIHPLGEPQPVVVDVRVIAATNANLERLVAEGRFREDLFYRLNVVRLTLPPLRERREEIPPLVQHYLERFGQEQKKGRLTLADETLEYLLLYAWPGNVRQLANEVRRMVALAEPDSALTPAVLSPEIQASRRTIDVPASTQPEVHIAVDQPLPAAVEYLEQTMVRRALDRAHGRVEEAARLLGISRKGLFLKRRRWGIAQPGDGHATRRAPTSPDGFAG